MSKSRSFAWLGTVLFSCWRGPDIQPVLWKSPVSQAIMMAEKDNHFHSEDIIPCLPDGLP